MAEQEERLSQQVGEYRLLKQVGKGTFGTVYLAKQLYDHSQAAVKLLRLQLTSRKDLKEFLNEARSIRLRHQHIVPLLDFGLSHDDTPYLVMEYADGGTLRQHCPKGNKLSLDTIDTYVTQLASALQYAHDHRIIHRDVKPENMLLRADGTILLSDFGIAKVLEQNPSVSLQTQVGTPAYMPPEQSQGRASPASDQYALAVIVYEWLAGRLPFQGTLLEVIIQHRLDAPHSLQALCPEVPVQVEQVILQALAKTPEERFKTVQQFAHALHTALQNSSSTAQTGWPIDAVSSSEFLSGFPRPPEMPSPPPGKIQTPSPPQIARSGEIQVKADSQKAELPLLPPSPKEEPPTIYKAPPPPSSTMPVSRPHAEYTTPPINNKLGQQTPYGYNATPQVPNSYQQYTPIPNYNPTQPFRMPQTTPLPKSPIGLITGMTAAVVVVIVGMIITLLQLVPTSTTDRPTVASTRTPQYLNTSTPTVEITPTPNQNTNLLTGPSGNTTNPTAASIVTNPQTASSIDQITAAPTNLTDTFQTNTDIYVTFKLNNNTFDFSKNTGYVAVKFYADSNALTLPASLNAPLTISQPAPGGFFKVQYLSAAQGAAELYWCQQSDCSDEQLAQVVTFTVTS